MRAVDFSVNSPCTVVIVWLNPGGVLPHMGYIGTCRGIGYGFEVLGP